MPFVGQMMFFQRILVLIILLLSSTRSEKDQLSNKPILTQTENYSINMFLNASSGQYNSHLLFKEDAIYTYNESTEIPQNSTEPNTNSVAFSEFNKMYPFVNWIKNQKILNDQFFSSRLRCLSVLLPRNIWSVQGFKYITLNTNLSYNDQSLNCSKFYPIMYLAYTSLKSLKYNDCDKQKIRAIEIAAIKFIRLFNESLQENTCNQIEKICINDLRSFIESQKRTNLSGVSWNDLIKYLNLDSIKIDDSLSPCLFVARYEKINILRETLDKRPDKQFEKPPLCSAKSIACLEGVYTWNNLDQR